MPDYTKDIVVSWEEIHRLGRKLASALLHHSKWEGILCVTRGGMIPGGIIARELEIRHIETICIHSYHNKEQGNAKLIKSPEIPNDAENWLVVDDLSDTGNTFEKLRPLYPKAHFACLYVKPEGKPNADTFIEEIPQNTWIHFPWDLELKPCEAIIDKQATGRVA